MLYFGGGIILLESFPRVGCCSFSEGRRNRSFFSLLRSNVLLAPVLLRSNVVLVTMEMKSTSRCIATDICRISLMWEFPTLESRFQPEGGGINLPRM
jgi:hypothetical protein